MRWTGRFVSAALLIGFALGPPPLAAAAAHADSVQALGDLVSKGDFGRAVERGRALLSEVESRYGGESLETAAVLDRLAVALVGADFLTGSEEAERMARRALEIRERALGPEHLDVAASLLTLASVLQGLDIRVGVYRDVDQLVARALSIREAALGPDDPRVAACLALRGANRMEVGEFESARKDLGRALEIQARSYGEYDVRLAETTMSLAQLARATGDDDVAREYFERTLAIRERTAGSDSSFVLDALTELYNLAYATGDSKAAAVLSERIRRSAERCLDPMSPRLAMARAGVPESLARGEGERLLAELVGWYRGAHRALGPDHITTGIYAGNCGVLLLQLGRGKEALEYLSYGERAVKASVPEGHPALGIYQHYMGTACLQAGDAMAALAYLEGSLRVREASVGPESREAAETLHGIARAHWLLGDAPLAVRTALLIEERNRSSSKALATLSERQALRFAATRPNGLGVALHYAAAAGRESLSVAVWDAVIRSRAAVLDEVASRFVNGDVDPEAMRRREALAAARLRAANLTVRGPGAGGAESYRAQLAQAVEEKESAERAFAERSLPFRRHLASERAGHAEVSAAIPPGAAMISYTLQRFAAVRASGVPNVEPSARMVTSYFALVASRSGSVRVVRLGDADRIDSLVSRWTRNVATPPPSGPNEKSRHTEDDATAGADLRREIWDPLVPLLGNVSRVFVVPDGALHLVPLAALPAEDGRYLVERGPLIHYLSAERDLVDPPAPAPDHTLMLAIGGADFDFAPDPEAGERVADAAGSVSGGSMGAGIGAGRPGAEIAPYRGPRPGCPEFHDIRFDALPGSSREIDEVTRAWSGPEIVRLGREATEARFKREAPRCGMLHIATHGFSLEAGCSDEVSSRGIGRLKREDPTSFAASGAGRASSPAWSPLLRSGLALTGANHREEARPDQEDGILTAEEIASLDLSNVRWAVLSACNTGRGEIQAGEGVLGLRRAFQIAGARTLIMSLWPVDDEATLEWMGALYRARFRSGHTTAEAVRDAARAVLESRRQRGESDHPFYWGAFVAAGDWN